jgi:hypothetical protein
VQAQAGGNFNLLARQISRARRDQMAMKRKTGFLSAWRVVRVVVHVAARLILSASLAGFGASLALAGRGASTLDAAADHDDDGDDDNNNDDGDDDDDDDES